jgi:hypothetical protein
MTSPLVATWAAAGIAAAAKSAAPKRIARANVECIIGVNILVRSVR